MLYATCRCGRQVPVTPEEAAAGVTLECRACGTVFRAEPGSGHAKTVLRGSERKTELWVPRAEPVADEPAPGPPFSPPPRPGLTGRQKAAVAAVGAVGLLPVVAALALVGRGGGSGGAPAADEAGLVREVARHRFWKKQPSEAEVGKLVERIRAEQDDAVVFVDDQFNVKVLKGAAVQQWADAARRHGFRLAPPDGVGPRYLLLSLREFRTRPGRDDLLRALKREADEAEFRAPPPVATPPLRMPPLRMPPPPAPPKRP